MKKRLSIVSAIVIVSVGLLTFSPTSLANTSPVLASVDWVINQISPVQKKVTELEQRVQILEAQVEQLKEKNN